MVNSIKYVRRNFENLKIRLVDLWIHILSRHFRWHRSSALVLSHHILHESLFAGRRIHLLHDANRESFFYCLDAITSSCYQINSNHKRKSIASQSDFDFFFLFRNKFVLRRRPIKYYEQEYLKSHNNLVVCDLDFICCDLTKRFIPSHALANSITREYVTHSHMCESKKKKRNNIGSCLMRVGRPTLDKSFAK